MYCGLNPARFSAIISLDLGLSLFTMNFSMTLLEQLMKVVVLAEMYVAVSRECNNQQPIPWGRSFLCSPDLVKQLCYNINHGLSASLNKFC